jgi:hypothetical protein
MKMKNFIYIMEIALLAVFCSCEKMGDPKQEEKPNLELSENDSLIVTPGIREQLRVNYANDDPRQYLVIFTTGLSRKCPVYLWAHTNSWDPVNHPQLAEDVSTDILEPLLKQGIAVVSWESVNQIETNAHIKTCEADMKLVYAWMKEHANEYLLNLDSLYVGGGSRGSIVSWRFIHENPKLLKGAWFAEALPYPAGTSPEIITSITEASPYVRLTYKYNRSTHPTEEIHNPKYGWKVYNKYKELGIENKIEVLEDMGDAYYNGLWKFIRNPEIKPSSKDNN